MSNRSDLISSLSLASFAAVAAGVAPEAAAAEGALLLAGAFAEASLRPAERRKKTPQRDET